MLDSAKIEHVQNQWISIEVGIRGGCLQTTIDPHDCHSKCVPYWAHDQLTQSQSSSLSLVPSRDAAELDWGAEATYTHSWLGNDVCSCASASSIYSAQFNHQNPTHFWALCTICIDYSVEVRGGNHTHFVHKISMQACLVSSGWWAH